MVIASPAPEQTRISLRLPSTVSRWFENEVERIAKVENLNKFSLTGLLYRISLANLDFTNKAIARYQNPTPIATAPTQINQPNGDRPTKRERKKKLRR